MSLTVTIDEIINLASGAPEIRNRLFSLRTDAEALEDHVRTLEAEAENPILANEIDRLQAALDEAHEEIERLQATEHIHQKREEEFKAVGQPQPAGLDLSNGGQWRGRSDRRSGIRRLFRCRRHETLFQARGYLHVFAHLLTTTYHVLSALYFRDRTS